MNKKIYRLVIEKLINEFSSMGGGAVGGAVPEASWGSACVVAPNPKAACTRSRRAPGSGAGEGDRASGKPVNSGGATEAAPRGKLGGGPATSRNPLWGALSGALAGGKGGATAVPRTAAASHHRCGERCGLTSTP